MAESDSQIREERVCTIWQRMLEAVLGVCLLVGLILMLRYSPAAHPRNIEKAVLQKKLILRKTNSRRTTCSARFCNWDTKCKSSRKSEAMPALVLHRYRNSICFIYGVYRVGFPGRQPEFRARISGTGFVVSDGLLATNRHVAEPWYEDTESASLIRRGATPRLEKLLAVLSRIAHASQHHSRCPVCAGRLGRSSHLPSSCRGCEGCA